MFVPCIFQIKYNWGNDNARLALTGNSPALGEWTPSKALVADCVGDDGLHEVVAMLPCNSECHFKWCVLDKDSNIIYWGNAKESAFRVKQYMMYIQSTWNKDFSVVSIPDIPGSISRNKMTFVLFQMNHTENVQNGHLCLLGNQRTLGSWLVNDGCNADDRGRVITCLPVGAVVEFKWIFKTSDETVLQWEDGPNRTHTIEDGIITVIECNWNRPLQAYWRSKPSDLMQQSSSERLKNIALGKLKAGIHRFQPTARHWLYAGIAAFVGYGLYRMKRH